ncbi:AAA family ATPase [Streptomyces sp. MUM 136J]|nr:AAA family ATPase [Streptomyces sp. MUM 136J]
MVETLGRAPSVVLIGGEAGLGKSRLLREATGRVAGGGVVVLRGWCHRLREPLPFGPVIDALRQASPPAGSPPVLSPATAVLASQVPELAGWLPAADGGDPDVGSGPQLARAVHEVLAALGPVLVEIEDVHWADDATRELLLLLARNTPPGLRLALTYRGEDLPGHGNVLGSPYRRPVGVAGLDLVLAPLGREEVAELAAAVLGPTAAAVLGPQLYERSAGLPLAVEEDLRFLADRLAHAPGGAGVADLDRAGVPRVLQEAVGSRVAALPRDAVAVVQAAAVLAFPAGEELLARLAGLEEEEAEEALESALAVGVLDETGPDRYAFHHVLARQAVYQRMLGPRRRRLHRRAIDVLDALDPTPLVQIAYHARELGDPAAWIPRTRAAAEHAITIGDDGIAAAQLQQLLDEPALPTDAHTWAALNLSRIAVRRADTAASIDILGRIVADPALPAAVRGEIRLNLGLTLDSADPARVTQLETAADELEAERPELAAGALAAMSLGDKLARTRAQDAADMERALRLAERTDDPVAQATVLASRITQLQLFGDRAADALLEQLPADSGLDLARQRCRALHNSAEALYLRGRDDTAARLLREAEALADHADYEVLALACAERRLFLDLAHGRWEALADRIDTLLGRHQRPQEVRELKVLQARLDSAHGRWAEARRAASTALASPSMVLYLPACALLGRLDLLEGNPAAAWQTIQPALAALRHKNVWTHQTDLLPVTVQAALATGHRTEAEHLLHQATEGIQDSDSPAVEAEILLGRGLLTADTDPQRAVALLEEARLRYAAIPRPYHAAQAAEHVGRVLLGSRTAVAGGHLHQALATYTELGATADAARCQRMLRQAGQHRPVPRGRRGYGTDLSPRERQVADLLATGATNKDIAAALALSVRTTEHHVARVLSKLDTTREQLRPN